MASTTSGWSLEEDALLFLLKTQHGDAPNWQHLLVAFKHYCPPERQSLTAKELFLRWFEHIGQDSERGLAIRKKSLSVIRIYGDESGFRRHMLKQAGQIPPSPMSSPKLSVAMQRTKIASLSDEISLDHGDKTPTPGGRSAPPPPPPPDGTQPPPPPPPPPYPADYDQQQGEEHTRMVLALPTPPFAGRQAPELTFAPTPANPEYRRRRM